MKEPRKIPRSENEGLSLKHVKTALKGVDHVTALIHKVVLSTKETDLDHIRSVIGPGKSYDESENPSHHFTNYKRASYHLYKGSKITLYYSPKKGCYPKFMFVIVNHKQSLLLSLASDIPGLIVSSAEYTIDMCCKDEIRTSMLFYVLRRYMYFHHRTYTSMVGGQFSGVDVERKVNCAYYVWKKERNKKDIVLYERGNDNDHDQAGWPYETINRVRFEFTANRKRLVKLKIGDVKVFVKENKFHEVISKMIDFRIFRTGKLLPKYSQDYNATKFAEGDTLQKTLNLNFESFQEEFHIARPHIPNICQYTAAAIFLEPLKERIFDSIRAFEDKWKQRYLTLVFRIIDKQSSGAVTEFVKSFKL